MPCVYLPGPAPAVTVANSACMCGGGVAVCICVDPVFCSISIFLLASLMAGRRPTVILVQSSRECTLPCLSTGISNLLQPAQAEVVLGQLSTYEYLASLVPHAQSR
jgi:hypothetical protein